MTDSTCCWLRLACVIGVSITPGWRALILMPWGPRSTAAALTKPLTAAFDAM